MSTSDPPTALARPGESNRGTDPDWLARRTEDIVGLAYRQACDAVRIGALLNEARARLKHGAYKKWVRSRLPFSVPTAQRLRQVATAFAAFQSVHFEHFDESALYVLAEFRTPPEVRERAVDLVNGGGRVTRADALRMVAEFRAGEAPAPPAQSPAGGERERRCICYVRDKKGGPGATKRCPNVFVSAPDVRVCPRCRAREEKQVERARREVRGADAVRNWGRFERLVGQCPRLRIDVIEDTNHEDDLLYVGTAYPAADGEPVRQTPALPGLDQVVAHLLGERDEKRCAHCGEVKLVSEFNRDESEAFGVFRHCRVCTRARKADGKARARAEKAVRPTGESPA